MDGFHAIAWHAHAHKCVYHAKQMHIGLSRPGMGTHGYMHELLTQHVMQHHAFFVLQQKFVAGDS